METRRHPSQWHLYWASELTKEVECDGLECQWRQSLTVRLEVSSSSIIRNLWRSLDSNDLYAQSAPGLLIRTHMYLNWLTRSPTVICPPSLQLVHFIVKKTSKLHEAQLFVSVLGGERQNTKNRWIKRARQVTSLRSSINQSIKVTGQIFLVCRCRIYLRAKVNLKALLHVQGSYPRFATAFKCTDVEQLCYWHETWEKEITRNKNENLGERKIF